MRIQVNSDKNIMVDTRVSQFVRNEAHRVLRKFAGKLTRVEFHLSDVNSYKFGINDKRCVIEARPARYPPLSSVNKAQTVRQAVGGALTKLRSVLETFFGRLESRGEDTVTAKRSRPAIGRRRGPLSVASSSASMPSAGVGRVACSNTRRSSVSARRAT
jgi:hypothetical protein